MWVILQVYQQIKNRASKENVCIVDGVQCEIVMYLRHVGKSHTPTAGEKVKTNMVGFNE